MRWLTLLPVLVLLWGCGQELSDREAAARQALDDQAIVAGLAAEYQATTGWEDDLVYTFQVQERLITGRPTLFKALVDDVFHRSGKTFVRFYDNSYSALGSYFVFELECSRPLVDMILTRHSDEAGYTRFFEEYAVVADIQEVSKPVLGLYASPFSEYDAEVVVGTSDMFIVKGTCIDIAYIGAD